MLIHNLSETPSILNTFIVQLRDKKIQKDGMRFRRNIERIGEILGYELSKSLRYRSNKIETPLGHKSIDTISNNIVLCSILRAGLPLHNGLLNYFDNAENAFISAYRKHRENSDDFDIVIEYLTCPNLEGKTLLIADPMLATGQSILSTVEALKPFGEPHEIHIVSVIGAQDGINLIKKSLKADNVNLWIATIDEELNDKGYIVPGLGDAGDLAFGVKLQK